MGSARETKAPRREESNPNPTPTPWAASGAAEALEAGPSAVTVDGADGDERLRHADALSREEVLLRRCRRMRQLAQCYRRQYWALVEEVRVKHRDYYWEFGASPFDEEEYEEVGGAGWRGRAVEEGIVGGPAVGALEGSEENGRAGAVVGLGLGDGEGGAGRREERKRCAFAGCKSKAMPLTRFCHPHILADGKQTLYKACGYVTKSCGQSGSGPITCGKPVLRAAVPSLCHIHYQKAQRSISQALRKAGLNINSSDRPAPKLSVILAEYVHQIQARRREALNSAVDNIHHMDDEEVS